MQLVGPDGKQRNYQEGTPLVDIAPDYQAAYDTPIALGVLNGREVPLQMIPQEGDRICFLDMNSVESYNTYISTFLFVLIAAMNRARPQVMLEVQNTFGNALYCDIKNKIVLSDYDLADVAAEMKSMIQEKTPITLSFKKKQEAWSYVKPRFYCDQAPLLSALPDDVEIPVYELDGVSAYFVNPLLPHLGYLKEFDPNGVGNPPALWKKGTL